MSLSKHYQSFYLWAEIEADLAAEKFGAHYQRACFEPIVELLYKAFDANTADDIMKKLDEAAEKVL